MSASEGGSSAKRRDEFAWAVVTTFLTRFGSLGLAFLASILVTRGLGPEGRGELQVITNAASVAQLGLGLGLGRATVYFMAGERRSEFLPVFVGQFLLSCLGLVVVLGLAPLLPFAAVDPLRSRSATVLAILLAIGALAETFGGSILRGMQQFGHANRLILTSSTARTVGLGALVFSERLSVLAAGLVRAVTTGYVGSAALGRAKALGLSLRPAFRWKLWKESLTYAGLSFTYSVFQNLHYTADVFLVQQWRSTAEVGIYTAGTTLIQLLWHLPNAVGTVLLPASVGDAGLEKAKQVARTSRVVFAVMTLAAIVLALFAPLIVKLMFGDEFAESSLVVRLLAPGVAASALHQIGAVYLAAQGNFRPLTWVAFLGFTLNMVANVFVIPRWGIVGAALVSSFSYSLSALVSTHLFCRAVGLPSGSALFLTRDDLKLARDTVRRKLGGRR